MIRATLNLGGGTDADKILDLNRLRSLGAVIICLQEAGDRQRVLSDWCRRHGWTMWTGRAPGGKSVPILYAPTVRPSRRFSRLAVPRRYVGPGAGPRWSKAKAVVGIRVDDDVTLNTHMIASATRTGGLYWRRRKHYKAQARVLARMITRRIRSGYRVTSVGDFNAPDDFYLLTPIESIPMVQHTDEPTHDGRVIDLVWTSRGLVVPDVRVVPMSGDHNGVVASIRAASEGGSE